MRETPRQVDLALWHDVFRRSLNGTAAAQNDTISDLVDQAIAIADEAVIAVHASRNWELGKNGWTTEALPEEVPQ